jgi:hypothetical protein
MLGFPRTIQIDPLFLLLLPFVAFCGCGGEAGIPPGEGVGSEGGGEPESWHLSDAPVLVIGVREGEEEYQLDRASASTRLADGRIVVLDGGSRQLRFFDSTGVVLGTVGMEGEGPGEFRNPTRLRRTFGDSLQVWDARLSRLSFFDDQGSFRSSSIQAPSPEDPMPLDEWLFQRNWIDSPLPAASRGPIRRAILAMPAPDSLGPPRFLKVTRQGRIWAADRFPPSSGPLRWSVYDLAAKRSRRSQMPEGIDVAILLADERGWTGFATHRETQLTCALAIGFYLPMGWPPGDFVCP